MYAKNDPTKPHEEGSQDGNTKPDLPPLLRGQKERECDVGHHRIGGMAARKAQAVNDDQVRIFRRSHPVEFILLNFRNCLSQQWTDDQHDRRPMLLPKDQDESPITVTNATMRPSPNMVMSRATSASAGR